MLVLEEQTHMPTPFFREVMPSLGKYMVIGTPLLVRQDCWLMWHLRRRCRTSQPGCTTSLRRVLSTRETGMLRNMQLQREFSTLVKKISKTWRFTLKGRLRILWGKAVSLLFRWWWLIARVAYFVLFAISWVRMCFDYVLFFHRSILEPLAGNRSKAPCAGHVSSVLLLAEIF